MLFDMNFFSHYRAVAQCLGELGVQAKVDYGTLQLLVRGSGREVQLLPQFVCRRESGIAYTPGLSTEARGFIGWRPYFNRVWPHAIDKLLFKQFCADNALRTPRHYTEPAAIERAVIVKRSRSSFGQGLTGPISLAQLAASKHPVTPGDYFEEFIEGEIAKIWYWNETPVALEILQMPSVTGDGRSTLRKLIETKKTFFFMHGRFNFDVAATIAEYQGLTLDSVVPEGKRVLTDFRYQSPLHHEASDKQNALIEYADRASLAQIKAAGRQFCSAIPENIRANTLYTIDAMIDREDTVWYLEMNCNPMVHVDAYRPMLTSLLATASAPSESAQARQVFTAAQA
jgi:hypothetical protein